MPVMVSEQATRAKYAGARAKVPMELIAPFVDASYRHEELIFDTSFQQLATRIPISPIDIPAYGFLRGLRILITASGGVIGAGVLRADSPYAFLQEISVTDPGGGQIAMYPLDGYGAYLASTFGAYRGANDPGLKPGFSNTVNPSFEIRVPVEVTLWDGYGAFPSLDQAATPKLRLSIGSEADTFSTAPTTRPLIRVRIMAEYWAVPPGVNPLTGQAQEQAPPGVGTVQYWSKQVAPVNTGAAILPVRRVGNAIRNLVLVHRDNSAGAPRSGAMVPATYTLRIDGADYFRTIPAEALANAAFEAFGITPPTGVVILPYTDDQDGSAGSESRHLWIITTGASRIEFEGTMGATGNVEILVNDVAMTAAGK